MDEVELNEEISLMDDEDETVTLEDALTGMYYVRESIFTYMQYAASEEQEELLEDLSIMDHNLNVALYFLEDMKRGEDVSTGETSDAD